MQAHFTGLLFHPKHDHRLRLLQVQPIQYNTFIKQLQPWSFKVVADGIYISVDADTALECYNLYRCVPC